MMFIISKESNYKYHISSLSKAKSSEKLPLQAEDISSSNQSRKLHNSCHPLSLPYSKLYLALASTHVVTTGLNNAEPNNAEMPITPAYVFY